MARKKDERLVKQAYKEERKAKAAQKKAAEAGGEPYLQPNDDHFVSFKKQLATMGLMLRDIPGDGNCLFRALNDQLEGHSRNHMRLRHDTVRFMIEHRQDFEPFVEDDVPFQTHVRQLSQSGTYGGHDALVAFAKMHKVNIVIHQLNSPLWQIEGGPNGCSQLHLSYHNGEHYSSVRRAGDTSETAANIRINVNADAVAGTSGNNAKKGQERRFAWPEASGVDNVDDCVVQRISDSTGCKDLSMITEALIDADGDEHAAADYITSLMMATEQPETGNVDDDDLVIAASASASASAITTASSPPDDSTPVVGRGRGKTKVPGVSAKKLTNKQRKEQNRKEKAAARTRSEAGDDRKSVGDQANDPADDALVVESAFGCLRI